MLICAIEILNIITIIIIIIIIIAIYLAKARVFFVCLFVCLPFREHLSIVAPKNISLGISIFQNMSLLIKSNDHFCYKGWGAFQISELAGMYQYEEEILQDVCPMNLV